MHIKEEKISYTSPLYFQLAPLSPIYCYLTSHKSICIKCHIKALNLPTDASCFGKLLFMRVLLGNYTKLEN